jgi:hypothetical protein
MRSQADRQPDRRRIPDRFGIAALAGTVGTVRWVVEGGHVAVHSAGLLPTQ